MIIHWRMDGSGRADFLKPLIAWFDSNTPERAIVPEDFGADVFINDCGIGGCRNEMSTDYQEKTD